MNEVKILDPGTFPLHGMRLIEASAGTGKTFTIAALYLRLLLGHGDPGSRHARGLDVDQILVVTFTEAATEELRDTRWTFARARLWGTKLDHVSRSDRWTPARSRRARPPRHFLSSLRASWISFR